jgi:molybdenum cofactor cytidylyltransferase
MKSRPTIIVQATAAGRRYGAPARPGELPAGASVLGTTLAHALQTGLPVVVVITEDRVALVAEQLARRDTIVISDADALRGSGFAIAVAVAERASSPGWLVLPGDLPMVRPSTLLAVAQALDVQPLAYAQYRGRRGHPVGFGAELYSELSLLSGDDGVRRLIARYPGFAAEVDDPGVRTDVEGLADGEALRAVGSVSRG